MFEKSLLTEQSNKRSFNLDIMNTNELVCLFSEEDVKPQIAVSKSLLESQKQTNLEKE